MWKSVLECGEGEGRCGEVGKVRVVGGGGMCGEVLREVWKSVLGCGEMWESVGEGEEKFGGLGSGELGQGSWSRGYWGRGC